jgi:hypothetical protein
MSHATLLHHHCQLACRSQRSCLGAYVPWLISQCAVMHNLSSSAVVGPPSPVPGWVGMARVMILRICPSLHPLRTLLCAAFCAPEAVVSGLLPIVRDQGSSQLLLAIACLGNVQQRPGLDLPQLREGVVQWLTSPGLPAEEVFEVISHLVWTHQTTSCWVLDPPFLFVAPTLTLLDLGRHVVRLTASLLSRPCDTVQPLVTRWLRSSPPFLAALVGCCEPHGKMEVFWR